MEIETKKKLLRNVAIISSTFIALGEAYNLSNPTLNLYSSKIINALIIGGIGLVLISLIGFGSKNERTVDGAIIHTALLMSILFGFLGSQKYIVLTTVFTLPCLFAIYLYRTKNGRFYIACTVIMCFLTYSAIILFKHCEAGTPGEGKPIWLTYLLFMVPYILEFTAVTLTAKPLINKLDEATAKVKEINEQTKKNNYKIIEFCASVLSNHSSYLKFHNTGVRYYTTLILEELKKDNPFRYTKSFIDAVTLGSYIHDIGKVSISDTILDKTGPLTGEEFGIIKTHCVNGVGIFDKLPELSIDEFTRTIARNCILYHHEKLDGTGYLHLKGAAIPLEAQIIAVADMADAILSYRAYKKPKSIQQLKIILASENKDKLNQDVVNAFFKHESEILQFSESQNDLIKNDLHY